MPNELGATPNDQTVTFRVWAPSAKSVSVVGTFNEWQPEAHPLAYNHDGTWSGDVPGVAIGDEYKFYIINPQLSEPLWKNDPYAAEVSSKGNSVIADRRFAWSEPPFVCPLPNDLVIYEIHVGTFVFDAKAESQRGTFRSIQSKLPYLRDLGINAIEILAAGKFPMDRFWGYNTSHIFAIESSFGGPNGFRELVEEANRHGIAVILEVVYNHLGPNDLDLWRFDGRDFEGNGGIYFYDTPRAHTPWGDTRPHYGAPQVKQLLRENAVRWIDSRGADGLRWNATAYIRNVNGRNDGLGDLADGWTLMMSINDRIHHVAPTAISIAEDLCENPWLTKPTSTNGAGFDAQWCAGFVHLIRDVVCRSDDRDRNMQVVRDAVVHRCNEKAFQRVIYSESYEEAAKQARLPEAIWPGKSAHRYSKKRSTLAAAVVFTAPGIPMIFQGQEFLEDGMFDDSRELDWRKLNDHSGIHLLYRNLIRLRRNLDGVTRGLMGEHVNVCHINENDKLIAFHRWFVGGAMDDVMVLLNFSNVAYDGYTIGMPRQGLWEVRFNSDWRGYASEFDGHDSFDTWTRVGDRDGFRFHADVSIGSYAAVILSQTS